MKSKDICIKLIDTELTITHIMQSMVIILKTTDTCITRQYRISEYRIATWISNQSWFIHLLSLLTQERSYKSFSLSLVLLRREFIKKLRKQQSGIIQVLRKNQSTEKQLRLNKEFIKNQESKRLQRKKRNDEKFLHNGKEKEQNVTRIFI